MITLIIITELIFIIILSLPYMFEVYDDRHGDSNKKDDVYIRGLMCIISGLAVSKLSSMAGIVSYKAVIPSIALSGAIHFLLFDYTIAYILIKNKIIETKESWFSYLGKSSKIDNWTWWRSLKPWYRLYIRLAVFIVALLCYILI